MIGKFLKETIDSAVNSVKNAGAGQRSLWEGAHPEYPQITVRFFELARTELGGATRTHHRLILSCGESAVAIEPGLIYTAQDGHQADLDMLNKVAFRIFLDNQNNNKTFGELYRELTSQRS
jgi:hypothetical protein